MRELEEAIIENDKDTRKVIAIAGGDGSLGTTIKHLRVSPIIDTAMQQGSIYFATLPYGTGNDGPQVFGWGASP
jgi:diacylglycerol kinase family enzyme